MITLGEIHKHGYVSAERRRNCVNLSNILKSERGENGKRLHDANTKSTCETIRLTAAETCYCSDVTAPPRYYL